MIEIVLLIFFFAHLSMILRKAMILCQFYTLTLLKVFISSNKPLTVFRSLVNIIPFISVPYLVLLSNISSMILNNTLHENGESGRS